MKNKQLPVTLLPRELAWGIRYLFFQLCFLGSLLSWLLILIGQGSDKPLLNFICFATNFCAVVGIFHKFLWHSLKHSLSHWVKLLLAAVIGFLVYALLFQGLHMLIKRIDPNFFNVNDQGIAEDSRSNFVLTALGAVGLVPLAEEMLYRGLVFGALHSKNRYVAYILSTLLFAFIHIMGYIGEYDTSQLVLSFIQYIPAGLVLAWSYEYSGSIFAPFLIHTAVNAFAIFSPMLK